MTLSAANASRFYEDVVKSGVVWAIKDRSGFPAPIGTDGLRAMPFWSSRGRAAACIERASAYSGLSPHQIPLNEFVERWLPGLAKDGLLVGLNWSGMRASGFDIPSSTVAAAIEHVRRGAASSISQ